MPMNDAALKAKLEKTIYKGLKKEFAAGAAPHGFASDAEDFWEKLSKAIAPIAADIVKHVQDNATVLPGIPLIGGAIPGPGATSGPGKIK